MDSTLNNLQLEISPKILKKMLFILNALENGWTINKKKELYIFKKNHEGKKEIYNENYLSTFIEENCNIKNINDFFLGK